MENFNVPIVKALNSTHLANPIHMKRFKLNPNRKRSNIHGKNTPSHGTLNDSSTYQHFANSSSTSSPNLLTPHQITRKIRSKFTKKNIVGLMLFLYTRRLPLFCKKTGSADLADPTAPDLTEVAILQLCAPTSTHRRPCWVSSCVPFEIKSRNAD